MFSKYAHHRRLNFPPWTVDREGDQPTLKLGLEMFVANLTSRRLMQDQCTIRTYTPGTVSLPSIACYWFSFKGELDISERGFCLFVLYNSVAIWSSPVRRVESGAILYSPFGRCHHIIDFALKRKHRESYDHSAWIGIFFSLFFMFKINNQQVCRQL